MENPQQPLQTPRTPTPPQNLDLLTSQALKTLQDPHYNPESQNYDKISSLFHNLDIFKKTFGSSSNLGDFIHLAKWHLNYEVHSYGSVLLKEQDYSDRICIILDGKMLKFQQKPFSEVEIEAKEQERRNSIAIQPMPMSPNLNVPDQRKQRRRLSAWGGSPSPQAGPTDSPRIELPKLDTPKIQVGGGALEIRAAKPRKHSMMININPVVNTNTVPSLNEIEPLESNRLVPASPGIQISLLSPSSNNLSPQVSPQAVKDQQQVNQVRKRLSVFNYQSNMLSSPRELNYPSFMELKEEKEEKADVSVSVDFHKNHLNLLQAMVTKQPEIKSRCFYKDVPRVVLARELKQGEWFGENIFRHHQTKENSILAVASDEVHLLTLSRDSYRKLLTDLSSQVNKKAHFFKGLFPMIDEKVIIKFSKHFDEKILQKDEVLYHENDPAEALYFVQNGEIKLLKDKQSASTQIPQHIALLVSPRTAKNTAKKKELPVAMVREKQVCGEELILDKEVRQYKAVVSATNTEVYILEGHVYRKIKEKYEDFFEILLKQAQEKSDWRQERVLDLLDQLNVDKKLSSSESASPPQRMTSSHFFLRPLDDLSVKKNESVVIPSPSGGGNGSHRLHSGQGVIRRTSLKTPSNNPEDLLAGHNSDLYKQKFGRTVKTPAYLEDEPLGSARKGARASKFFTISNEPIDENPLEFNVRKELDEKQRPKILHTLSPRITSPSQQAKPKAVIIKSTKSPSKKKLNPMIITTSLEPKPLEKAVIHVHNVRSETRQQTQECESPVSPGTLSDLDEPPAAETIFSDKATMNKLLKAVNYKHRKKKMSLLIVKDKDQGKKSRNGSQELNIGKIRSYNGIC